MSNELKWILMLVFGLLMVIIEIVVYNKLAFHKNDMALPIAIMILLGITIFGEYGIFIL